MSSPIAFEIASFSCAPVSVPAEAGSVLLLPADSSGKAAPEAEAFVDKGVLAALAESSEFQSRRFAAAETLLFPKAGSFAPQFSRVILINAGGGEDFSPEAWLELGGACRKAAGVCAAVTIACALPQREFDGPALESFICGFKLRHYRFDKYKTYGEDKKAAGRGLVAALLVKDSATALRALDKAQILADSVILARDLVNEPANILGTEECAAQIKALAEFGIEVDILDKAALEQAGLRALLAVAQGSERPPYLAVMRWSGGAAGEAPLALIGKGVVFDSGGISLKRAEKMEDMKGDMGGAAAVIGAMRALAARKAKANIIGLVGLVENMPDANAQRPGDIVTSLSGQTIEIVNTDAEGRLVLADVLWFAKENFKPRLMIDFATLTGAVVVALGTHYAGLYANDKALSARLAAAGQISGEHLWPMPLSPAYDKKLKSRFADMRNSCGRDGGSITAAQFLQRFVGETPWAHLDIAGTAFDAGETLYNTSWATGFGVRLINQLIAEFYEGAA